LIARRGLSLPNSIGLRFAGLHVRCSPPLGGVIGGPGRSTWPMTGCEKRRMSMIGYKLLRADLSSLSGDYRRVQYGPEWTDVPGNGAYIGLTLPGLLRGGLGEVLARVEYKSPTGKVNDGDVVTARRVRILQHAPVDIWAIVRAVIWGARQVLPPKGHPLRAACLRAVKAAERCEKERTPEAADEAARASSAAASAADTKKAVDKPAAVSPWVAWAAAHAGVWAADAAAWAAEAAMAASWSADVAAEAVADAAEEASVFAAEAVADEARRTDFARRILERFVDQVLPPPLRLRRKGG